MTNRVDSLEAKLLFWRILSNSRWWNSEKLFYWNWASQCSTIHLMRRNNGGSGQGGATHENGGSISGIRGSLFPS